MPMTTAVISQNSGTKAATTAVSSPAAQAARRARRRGAVKTLPTSTATGGRSTSRTAVPSRPDATAPIPTGSSAYASDPMTRAGTYEVTRRLAR